MARCAAVRARAVSNRARDGRGALQSRHRTVGSPAPRSRRAFAGLAGLAGDQRGRALTGHARERQQLVLGRRIHKRVTESTLQEARTRVVAQPSKVTLDLAVLPVVVVGSCRHEAANAAHLRFDSAEGLLRVKDRLAVRVHAHHVVPVRLEDAHNLPEALRHVRLELDLDDHVPVGVQINGAKDDGAPPCTSLACTRVRAEVRVLPTKATGARLVEVEQLGPVGRHVIAHLGHLTQHLDRLVHERLVHLPTAQVPHVHRVPARHLGAFTITAAIADDAAPKWRVAHAVLDCGDYLGTRRQAGSVRALRQALVAEHLPADQAVRERVLRPAAFAAEATTFLVHHGSARVARGRSVRGPGR
eukprot:scaffold18104_cov38-Phaeocystis_antarctica.AAC.2